jgi:hypothetical protein
MNEVLRNRIVNLFELDVEVVITWKNKNESNERFYFDWKKFN